MRKSQRVLNIAGRDFMDDVSDDSGAEEEPGTALRPEAAGETAGEDFGAEAGIPTDGNPHTPAALVQALSFASLVDSFPSCSPVLDSPLPPAVALPPCPEPMCIIVLPCFLMRFNSFFVTT